MGISCELLESDFLKCSVGFPFMRSKSKVRPWQRWVLPRPLSPSSSHQSLVAMHACTYAHTPCLQWWLGDYQSPGVCLPLVLCSRESMVTSPVSLSHIIPNQGRHHRLLCALLMVKFFCKFLFRDILYYSESTTGHGKICGMN